MRRRLFPGKADKDEHYGQHRKDEEARIAQMCFIVSHLFPVDVLIFSVDPEAVYLRDLGLR